MKTFAQFIKEAVETLASTEAKNRGLVGNGHGDWYDKQGNFVAKTVNGRLKFFGQGDTVSKDGVPGEEVKKQKQQQIASPQKISQPEPEPEEPAVNGVVIVVGRFNPPSKNHLMLLKSGFDNAKRRGFEYRIYPSRIQDGAINPLNPETKIAFMKSMFSEYADYIVDSENARTIFDILGLLYDDSYTDVVIVAGQERLGEFQSLVHKADGEKYQFNNIEVITSGVRDPDSEVENPGSSAMMRTAAALQDYERFSTGLPPNMNNAEKEELFNSLINSMNVTEDTELWRIAPELDYEGMRKNYKLNYIFDIGSLVENINSGLVGRVIRRGTNYLICVTKEGIMFKSWLKDLHEVYEVGTCEYRAYAQSMTPGQPVTSYTDVEINPTMKKKINTSRKKVSKVK